MKTILVALSLLIPGLVVATPHAVLRNSVTVTSTSTTPVVVFSDRVSKPTVYTVTCSTFDSASGSHRGGWTKTVTAYPTSATAASLYGSVTSLYAAKTDVGLDVTMAVSSKNMVMSVVGLAATTLNWNCYYDKN